MKSNYKNIGLFGGGFKPFHKGHFKAIQKASMENDVVWLYVSTSNRFRKNEYPITWDKMKTIWTKYITSVLPKNVFVSYVTVPVTPIMELLYDANETKTNIVYSVYSDEQDLRNNFFKLKTKLQFLYCNNQLHLKPTDRLCSGTDMRLCLQNKQKTKFINQLPRSLSGEIGSEIYEHLLY